MPLDEPVKKEGEVPVPVQEEEEDPMATKQTQILEQVGYFIHNVEQKGSCPPPFDQDCCDFCLEMSSLTGTVQG